MKNQGGTPVNLYNASRMYHRSVYFNAVLSVKILAVVAFCALASATWSLVRYEALAGKAQVYMYQLNPYGQVIEAGLVADQVHGDGVKKYFIRDVIRYLRQRSVDSRAAEIANHELQVRVDEGFFEVIKRSVEEDPATRRCSRQVLIGTVLPVGRSAEGLWNVDWKEVSHCSNRVHSRSFEGFITVEQRKVNQTVVGHRNPLGLVVTDFKVQEHFDKRERSVVKE